MTVARGAPWGAEVPRPDGLRWCADDAAAAAVVAGASGTASGARPLLAVRRSAMGASVGHRGARDAAVMLATRWDAIRLRLERGSTAREVVTLGRAWVVAQAPRGMTSIVATTSPVGGLDLHPRAHPNDGALHALEIAAHMAWRQRVVAWRRAHRGDHLPHPSMRASRAAAWSSPPGRWLVWSDGRWVGRADRVHAEVIPDACTLHW